MEAKIKALVEQKINDTPDELEGCYVVEVVCSKKHSVGTKIEVFVEGDNGINITQCSRLNRYLQHVFDETPTEWFGESYGLDVSSPGVGSALKVHRQYIRNIGRTIVATLLDGMVVEGILAAADEENLSVEREVTTVNEKKKKIKELITVVIPFISIEKAKIKATF